MARWNMANYNDIHALQDKVDEIMKKKATELIIQQMQYIGETCIKIARNKSRANTWGDVTGNLRSSIGYVVQFNGKPVAQGAMVQYKGTEGNGTKGGSAAKNLMNALRGTKQQGIVLYVVAGMNYAEYVESIHHKDVLASAWLEGERLAHKLLDQLFSKTKGA